MKANMPPRVRLAKHIDLSKADPDCENCKGSGVAGYKEARLSATENKQKIPIICKCVTRNGGVQEDALDRIAKQIKADIDEGVFAKNLAADIMGMNMKNRTKAIEQLTADLENPMKSEETKAVTRATLEILGGGGLN